MKDFALRAITDDGAFRVVAVRTTETVAEAVRVQRARPELVEIFGELLTSVVLIRQTMSPDHRVQAVLQRQQGGSLFADSHPDGNTRGLVSVASEHEFELGEGTLLQVIRVLTNGELHTGVVATEPEHGLSASLTTYMQRSEQITTDVEVGCAGSTEVARAGGYLVQVLPGAEPEHVRDMLERLETLPSLHVLLEETDADPARLIARVLEGVDHHVFEPEPVRFGCNCSEARVVGALATMGREEIERIVEEQETLEIDCDYCNANYRIGPLQLRSLLH